MKGNEELLKEVNDITSTEIDDITIDGYGVYSNKEVILILQDLKKKINKINY